ncbi:flavin-dependent oxidoreductase, F420-dependent methylene-tetrahydromethanopterin reductase [Actinobacteria bacterium IMCC26256]|nr:flavin-dependent oxidoreductase, F420-dependent methylene-tetrahydromethanopterin reductase [Actinobacteria bacterium IMCC26256]
MRFGVFIAPFHPVGQNPTLALERDLDLVVHLDRLGYEEAWIGEHHSGGYEIIASPEVFIAVAAERTKHIRLGTGVASLPYHHPLLLADRMVLLDHLTHGRVMLGVGPGQLTSDAHMLGIPSDTQRPRMEESLDAIMALLRGERVTMKTDGFILEDAHLQLSSYSKPHLEVAVAASFSPTGPRSAGKHGVGMISIAATARQGMDMLSHHYDVWDEIAKENGHTVDRSSWRLVGPMHIAETREQAERDVEFGIEDFSKYFSHVLPGGPVSGETVEEILENNRISGFAVIGSPEDAIARIQELLDASNGGFGAFLFLDHNWANPTAKHRSYELFAQYVMPHFQDQIAAQAESHRWLTESGGEFVNRAVQAISKATTDHAEERRARDLQGDSEK